MPQDDVTQIRVGVTSVGIVGLKAAFEEVAVKYGQEPDSKVAEGLLNRLDNANYIPDRAREEYGKAFLREFKKFLGRPYEDVAPGGLQVKVLGPGCVQCDRLEQELIQVMAETGITADLEHVRDPKEIGQYGVMGTPALVINGQVKSVGRVPPRNRLKEWLQQAQDK
ncbi:MAG: thioredoxin family protein [Thermodesulfobacteriota bacterium]